MKSKYSVSIALLITIAFVVISFFVMNYSTKNLDHKTSIQSQQTLEKKSQVVNDKTEKKNSNEALFISCGGFF